MNVQCLEEEIQKHLTEYDKAMPAVLCEKKQYLVCIVRELQELPELRRFIHRRKQLQQKIKLLKHDIQQIESGVTKHNMCQKSMYYIRSMQHSQLYRKFVDKTVPVDTPSTINSNTRKCITAPPSCVRNKTIRKSIYSGTANPISLSTVETGGRETNNTQNTQMIIDEFKNHPSSSSRSVYVLPYLKCSTCGIHMHKLIDASVMVCPKCGTSTKYLDSSSKSLGYHDDIEYITFSYKRQNHFQEWLNAFQGRENTVIPPAIITKVMGVLFKNGIRNNRQITRDCVRQILKKHKLRRYYDNITSIISQITGEQPMRLRPDEEEQLKLMFMSIQKPFNRHRPSTRKNFLSYSYVLFKFCELLGLNIFLNCFRLLKGREKLHKQDQIFEKICKELEWEFIPSI